MILESLRIRQFRNLGDVTWSPRPGLNLLWGSNAQGKTSVLEAIYYLATGQSFRTSRDEEVLPFGSAAGGNATAASPGAGAGAASVPTALVQAKIARAATRHELTVAIRRDLKSIRIDGKALRRLTELWGLLAVVVFVPGDLQLVYGGPAMRRQWVDVALSQVNLPYLDALKNFTKALRQRNALLRMPHPHPVDRVGQIRAYEQPLAQAAGTLFIGRQHFFQTVSAFAATRYAAISGRAEALTIKYQPFLDPEKIIAMSGAGAGAGAGAGPSAPVTKPGAAGVANGASAMGTNWPRRIREEDVAEAYGKLLAQRRNDDMARGMTTEGPHRDDCSLLLNGRDAKTYASQGQVRSIALALRLAEVDTIRRATGHPPLLLLDDLLSELDPQRLRYLLTALSSESLQSVLTTTDPAPVRDSLPEAGVWEVRNGQIVS